MNHLQQFSLPAARQQLCPPDSFLLPTHPCISPTAVPRPQRPPKTNPSPEMEAAVSSVERIVNYNFWDKTLLEAALTHPSFTESAHYQRLEFIGDAALGLAFSSYVFLAHPNLDPGQLSLLRAANVSTEKLARVAVRRGLYNFVRRRAAALDEKVREFSEAVSQEDDAVIYGGSVKAPKVLADIVESVAGAVYVDLEFDLEKTWMIIRGLLEPIVTLEDLQQQPQPVTMLFELCQKQGKQVNILHWKKGIKNIASVYVDGEFVASVSSEQKEIAKLNAAKGALFKLSEIMPTNGGLFEIIDGLDGSFEIQGAKQKLHDICGKKGWPKPTYNIVNEEGPSHKKKFTCSVLVPTEKGVLCMEGDEKAKVKEAENSAASNMIRALQERVTCNSIN